MFLGNLRSTAASKNRHAVHEDAISYVLQCWMLFAVLGEVINETARMLSTECDRRFAVFRGKLTKNKVSKRMGHGRER